MRQPGPGGPGRTHAGSHCLVGRLIRAWLGASLVWLPVALPACCINSLMHEPQRMLIPAWPDRNGSDLRFCGAWLSEVFCMRVAWPWQPYNTPNTRFLHQRMHARGHQANQTRPGPVASVPQFSGLGRTCRVPLYRALPVPCPIPNSHVNVNCDHHSSSVIHPHPHGATQQQKQVRSSRLPPSRGSARLTSPHSSSCVASLPRRASG